MVGFTVLDCKLRMEEPPGEEERVYQEKVIKRCSYLELDRAGTEGKLGMGVDQLEDDPELLYELQLLAGAGAEGELELRNEEDGKSTRKYVLHECCVHLYYGAVCYPDVPDVSFGLMAISELESAGEGEG
jgi:hypothetical protein